MIKKIVVLFIFLFSASAFTCPVGISSTDPNFCAAFKEAAKCHCTESGMPGWMCNDMNKLWSRMITVFRSVQRACQSQPYSTVQECVDNWTCYRQGGVNSNGSLCSSTGAPCQ